MELSVDRIKFLFHILIEGGYLKKCCDQLVDIFNVTQIKGVNTVFFYLSLCMLYFMVLSIIKLIIALLIKLVEIGISIVGIIMLGKRHQKSLNCNVISLWYIKFKADMLYLLYRIKFDILDLGYWDISIDTRMEWIRVFSIENVVWIVKKVFKFFFKATVIHLVFGIITIFTYYKKDVLGISKSVKNIVFKNGILPNEFMETFQIITVLCLLGYIVLDIRHKVNGYSSLRAERFKELIQMEEKLCNILNKIIYLLKNNINVIGKNKYSILTSGASELSGKNCYIDGDKIKFWGKKRFGCTYSKSELYLFYELDDMEEEFQELSKVEEEFQKSSLTFTNIKWIDHQTMLNQIERFWILGIDDKDYKKMEFLCKSSMEEWYNNKFVKPIGRYGSEARYYSEEESKEQVLDASRLLDFELLRAFILELYFKRYVTKMTKRFNKLNKFSRFNLN